MDSVHQVIVAAEATDQATDKQQAVPMVEQAIANMGMTPKEVSADAGYYSARAVEELCALGVDPFIAPERTRHGQAIPSAPRGRIPQDLSARDRMRRDSCGQNGGGGGTACGRRRWSRCSDRSSRGGDSGSSCCGTGESGPGVAADLRRAQPAEAVPVRGRSDHQSTRQSTRLRPSWEGQGTALDLKR